MGTLSKTTSLFILQPSLYATLFLSISIFNANYANAQHHGAPPPFASIGDRKIIMNFSSTPHDITIGKPAQFKIYLNDAKTAEHIHHVTYRITVSKDNSIKMSNFFHSHEGDLSISIPNRNSGNIDVQGTFDPLTNAIISDPAGMTEITGPLFSAPGTYKVNAEVVTIDNDKTDLSNPLEYYFYLNVNK